MSVALHESPRGVTQRYTEADRRRAVADFDTAIDLKLKLAPLDYRDGYYETIGDEMRFAYTRGLRPPYARKFIIDNINGSALGYLFERSGEQGIKRTLFDRTRLQGRQQLSSSTLSSDRICQLPSIVRMEGLDLASRARKVLLLSPAEEALALQRGPKVTVS